MEDDDPGEYDACSYCNRSIVTGVAECPYCHNYTDGRGPYAVDADAPRKLPRVYVIFGWLLLLSMLLPLAWVLWVTFGR